MRNFVSKRDISNPLKKKLNPSTQPMGGDEIQPEKKGDEKQTLASTEPSAAMATVAHVAEEKTQDHEQDKTRNSPNRNTRVKARIWDVVIKNAPVFDNETLSGEPIGFLDRGVRIVCLNRYVDQGENDGNPAAVSHEEGWTPLNYLQARSLVRDEAHVGFSRTRHTRCSSHSWEMDMRETLLRAVQCTLVTFTVCLFIGSVGQVFVDMNRDYCPHLIQSEQRWLQNLLCCGHTHAGWNANSAADEAHIQRIFRNIRHTWEPKLWGSTPETLAQYLALTAKQPAFAEKTPPRQPVFESLCPNTAETAWLVQTVLDRWRAKPPSATLSQFADKMFQVCPACPSCPTTCPVCPVTYSSAVPDQTLGFCAPCPGGVSEKKPNGLDTVDKISLEAGHGHGMGFVPRFVPRIKWDLGMDDRKPDYATIPLDVKYHPVWVGDDKEEWDDSTLRWFENSQAARAIRVGYDLLPGYAIFSADGKYMMTMQHDCNLVVYKNFDSYDFEFSAKDAVWSSRTVRFVDGPCKLRVAARAIKIVFPGAAREHVLVKQGDGKDIVEVQVTPYGPKVVTA